MQLDVNFPTWKMLTNLLQDENDTYDAVVRRLIGAAGLEAPVAHQADMTEGAGEAPRCEGAYFKDIFLPEGTELRATHKGKTYFARISGSEWIDQTTGQRRNSPSQAAYFITNNHVNGWLFWLVKRPGDDVWHSLNALRAGQLR